MTKGKDLHSYQSGISNYIYNSAFFIGMLGANIVVAKLFYKAFRNNWARNDLILALIAGLSLFFIAMYLYCIHKNHNQNTKRTSNAYSIFFKSILMFSILSFAGSMVYNIIQNNKVSWLEIVGLISSAVLLIASYMKYYRSSEDKDLPRPSKEYHNTTQSNYTKDNNKAELSKTQPSEISNGALTLLLFAFYVSLNVVYSMDKSLKLNHSSSLIGFFCIVTAFKWYTNKTPQLKLTQKIQDNTLIGANSLILTAVCLHSLALFLIIHTKTNNSFALQILKPIVDILLKFTCALWFYTEISEMLQKPLTQIDSPGDKDVITLIQQTNYPEPQRNSFVK